MKYRYWMGLVASVCMVNAAHADLINVSTTSLESSTEEAIACTIIATTGATYQGYKVLVAFSEAVGSDANPTMRVQSLRSNIVYTNDDWQGCSTSTARRFKTALQWRGFTPTAWDVRPMRLRTPAS